MTASSENQLKSLLTLGVEQKLYSCAQLVVSEGDTKLTSLHVGQTRVRNCKNDARSPVHLISSSTLFDVASLTKPLATASLIMKACDEGILSVAQKLVSLEGVKFPPWLLSYTISDLLSHQTPLPAWFDFHGPHSRAEDHENAKNYFQREIVNMEPRAETPSWCYSDLGYILLGFILEQYYQRPLSSLFEEKIAEPLNLSNSMTYLPLHKINREYLAATCEFSNAYIQGHPDDANARALTHEAGHAGLFASAEAVSKFVSKLISRQFPCNAETIDTFLNYKSPNTPFALGWDRPTSDDSLSGRKCGENVIGHLGFTGCSVWIDLDTSRCVTFLTNRTHVNNDPKSLGDLRRQIHKICWEL